jgi:hypothetical protein
MKNYLFRQFQFGPVLAGSRKSGAPHGACMTIFSILGFFHFEIGA